jgi:hypothetical protein
MDNSIQQSLLSTVNQIVNNQVECEDCQYYELAEAIELALNNFETRFSINLTEQQEDSLIGIGINQLMNTQSTSNIDLSEQTIELINKYTPEEVFASIVEGIASGIASAAKTGMKFVGAKVAAKLSKTKSSGEEEESQQNDDDQRGAESTQDPYSLPYQIHMAALANTQADPNRRNVTSYLSESEVKQNPIKKHKKKLFKITFMDKGMKKRGTAVSHKGVMRIISGKSNFKVYDEKPLLL